MSSREKAKEKEKEKEKLQTQKKAPVGASFYRVLITDSCESMTYQSTTLVLYR